MSLTPLTQHLGVTRCLAARAVAEGFVMDVEPADDEHKARLEMEKAALGAARTVVQLVRMPSG